MTSWQRRGADFVEALRAWAARRDDIRGVAIVGSYARGTARPESDIDVIVITTDAAQYLDGQDWLRAFGAVREWQREDWGAVQSVRAFYADGSEIEFGITSEGWAGVPADEGTRSVVHGGFRLVYEREGVLTRLLASLGSRAARRGSMARMPAAVGSGSMKRLSPEPEPRLWISD